LIGLCENAAIAIQNSGFPSAENKDQALTAL
jgi:hypothetical protein